VKRFLSFFLAGLIIGGFVGVSAALVDFTDIGELSAAQVEAVDKLSDLGVMEGYPDGSFRPNNYVTRAELAKIICVFEEQEQLDEEVSAFNDVALTAWYSGWISRAAACGWVSGYLDGSYLPQNSVTQQEAAAILLRAEDVNTADFDWPNDYINMAQELGMLKGLDFRGPAKASRLDICLMLNNLLAEAEEENLIPIKNMLTDGLHIGMVKTAVESEFTFWHVDGPLMLDSGIRRIPKENTLIYFSIKDNELENWVLLLDTANGTIGSTTALKYRVVDNGPYSWVATRTGQTAQTPVDLNAAKPLVRYHSYRNIAVGPNSQDSRNYWLDDTCQIFVADKGIITPGSRANIELGQAVTLLVNDEDEVLFLICWI